MIVIPRVISTPWVHPFVCAPPPSSILPWSKQNVFCILHKFCPMETLKFHHGGNLILFSSIDWFGILPLDAGAFCFLIHMLGWHSTSWCRCYFPFSSIYWVHILPLDMDVFFPFSSICWVGILPLDMDVFFPFSSICWVGILPLDTHF